MGKMSRTFGWDREALQHGGRFQEYDAVTESGNDGDDSVFVEVFHAERRCNKLPRRGISLVQAQQLNTRVWDSRYNGPVREREDRCYRGWVVKVSPTPRRNVEQL